MIEPGIHLGLSNEAYHADQDYLSSSALKRLLPTYTDPDSAEALAFGTLAHEVAFEPDALDKYAPLDADVIGVKADGSRAEKPTATAAWKNAVAEAEQDGKTVIAMADWAKAHRMVDRLRDHKDAAGLLFGPDGTYEESAFWVDGAGLRHKARFDRRIPGVIADLKTTSAKSLDSETLAKVAADYLYDLSAAHYLTVAQGLGLDVDTFVLVFVSKHPPHHVYVAVLDDAFLRDGHLLRDRAIDRHVHGLRGIHTLTPPRWRHIDTQESA